MRFSHPITINHSPTQKLYFQIFIQLRITSFEKILIKAKYKKKTFLKQRHLTIRHFVPYLEIVELNCKQMQALEMI